MPNIAEVANFDTVVPAIQDTVTPLSAAGLNPPLQALADRTNFLKSIVDTLRAAAYMLVGTTAGTVAAGDHTHTGYAPSNILQTAFSVGSLYFNATNASNPASILGFGTWQTFGAGRMLLSVGGSHAIGEVGGEETHVLTIAEMPAHHHSFSQVQAMNWMDHQGGSGVEPFADANTADTGGGAAHNNMPPYISVYIWQRVA